MNGLIGNKDLLALILSYIEINKENIVNMKLCCKLWYECMKRPIFWMNLGKRKLKQCSLHIPAEWSWMRIFDHEHQFNSYFPIDLQSSQQNGFLEKLRQQ